MGWVFFLELHNVGGGGAVGGNPGVLRVGSLWEAGEEGAGGKIPKGTGAGRNKKKICNIVQCFAVGKAHRGGNHCGRGWEPRVHGKRSQNFLLTTGNSIQSK